MITATCTTTECKQHAIGYLVLGDPARVECGACHNDCELTDPQPDPPQQEPDA